MQYYFSDDIALSLFRIDLIVHSRAYNTYLESTENLQYWIGIVILFVFRRPTTTASVLYLISINFANTSHAIPTTNTRN